MTLCWRNIIAAAALALGACGSHAATPTATPATLQQLLDSAQPGDVIRLADGDYDAITLKNKNWTPSVVVEGAAGRMRSVDLTNVSGLTWRGGTFNGADIARGGFGAHVGGRIIVDGLTMSHYVRAGIGMGQVSDVQILNNDFADMGSDGIDVALSRRVVLDHNSCHDFLPTPGAHPDCIQLWSRPTDPPTADITITHNKMVGTMQGISLFNHVRNGVDDGGFDRVLVADNEVTLTVGDGISLGDCRDCIARNNKVDSLPEMVHVTRLIYRPGTIVACGNRMPKLPKFPGQDSCRKEDRERSPAALPR